MKKIWIVLLVFGWLLGACATDEPMTQDQEETTDTEDTDTEDTDDGADSVTDDFQVIAVTDIGDIVAIGNNTGALTQIGAVTDVNSLGSMGIVASNETAIYFLDRYYDPGPITELIIYNQQSSQQQRVVLNFPSSINGDDIGIVHMFWNQDKLMAFVAPNVVTGQPSIFYITTIDPLTFEMTDIGVTVNASLITSVLQIDNQLYIASWDETLMRTDLTSGISEIVAETAAPIYGSRLAQISNSQIAMMQSEPGFIGGVKPIVLSIDTEDIVYAEDPTVYGLTTVFGSTRYDVASSSYLNLVSSFEDDTYLNLLSVNTMTGEHSTTVVNTTTVSRNIVIIAIER